MVTSEKQTLHIYMYVTILRSLHLQLNQVSHYSRVAPVTLNRPSSRYSRPHLASPWVRLAPGGPAEPMCIQNRQ